MDRDRRPARARPQSTRASCPARRTPPSTPRSACCRSSRPATAGTSAGCRPRCIRTPALPTVFVYDGHAGGAGFAERGYDRAAGVADRHPRRDRQLRVRRPAARRACSHRSAATATSRSTRPAPSACSPPSSPAAGAQLPQIRWWLARPTRKRVLGIRATRRTQSRRRLSAAIKTLRFWRPRRGDAPRSGSAQRQRRCPATAAGGSGRT